MKPFAPLPLLCFTAFSMFAQGTVNFANVGQGLNAPVFLCDFVTKAGPSYRAQLYAGPSPSQLDAVGSPASFLTGGAAGYFSGGSISIPTVPPCGTAWVQVVVWDSTAGGTLINATPQQAFEHMAATAGRDGWLQSGCFSVVTGGCGSPPSSPAPLLGLVWCCSCGCAWDPFLFYGFTEQPQGQTVAVGGTVTFTAMALACHNDPEFTWYFNSNQVAGGASLTITNVQPSDAGPYWAVAGFPGFGSCMSRIAWLTVLPAPPPLITAQPQDRTAEVGSSASFSVAFTSSTPATCQWFLNRTHAVPGGTNSLLWLSDISPSQAGSYSVVISSASGSVTSAPAALSVISYVPRKPVPALELSGQPGTTVNLEVASSLTAPVNWQPLATLTFSNAPQFYSDLSFAPEARFYRAWQTGAPANPPGLAPRLAPAILLSGRVGQTLWLEAINMIGPTNAWFPVATIVLTNTSEPYPDVASIGQPPRLWRVIAGP